MRRIGLRMGTQGTHSSFSPPASVARPLWPWNTPSTNGHIGKPRSFVTFHKPRRNRALPSGPIDVKWLVIAKTESLAITKT